MAGRAGTLAAALCALLPRVATGACDVTDMGSLAFGDRARDIEVVGDLAYVAAGWHGLVVIDHTDPAAMAIVGAIDLGAYANDVEVEGGVAYVAASDLGGLAGLYTIDIGDPAALSAIGNAPGSFTQVALDGSYAYAIDSHSGLHIVDRSVPGSLVVIGTLDLPGAETDVSAIGDIAYVTRIGDDPVSGVRLVDVADRTAPVESGGLGTAERLPVDIAVSGDLAFVSSIGRASRGLGIYDLSQPAAITEVAFLEQPNARDVRLLGSRAYFAFGTDPNFGGGPGGLRIVDLSDPTTPVVIGAADTAGDEAAGLEVVARPDGDWVYLSMTGAQAGVRILRVSNCPEVVSGGISDAVPVTLDVPLAFQILGSAVVDVNGIDVGTLGFGPLAEPASTDPALQPVVQDVNGDGYDDLLVYFQTGGAGLVAGQQQACAEGLLAGKTFVACDWVSFDEPPVASFFANLGSGIAPLFATFDGSASADPEGGPLTYRWTFAGRSAGNGTGTHQNYYERTTSELTLTVWDAAGQQAQDSQWFEIYFDTDGDGIHDDLEYGVWGAFIDTDGDGADDHLDLDSDDDGIPDATEDVNKNGRFDFPKPPVFETDRLDPDTDGDGVLDGREMQHGTSPLDPDDFPGATSLPALEPGASWLVLCLAASGRHRLRRRPGDRL